MAATARLKNPIHGYVPTLSRRTIDLTKGDRIALDQKGKFEILKYENISWRDTILAFLGMGRMATRKIIKELNKYDWSVLTPPKDMAEPKNGVIAAQNLYKNVCHYANWTGDATLLKGVGIDATVQLKIEKYNCRTSLKTRQTVVIHYNPFQDSGMLKKLVSRQLGYLAPIFSKVEDIEDISEVEGTDLRSTSFKTKVRTFQFFL